MAAFFGFVNTNCLKVFPNKINWQDDSMLREPIAVVSRLKAL